MVKLWRMLTASSTSQNSFCGPTVVLHRPQIPQNTGNVARLCVALQSPLVVTGRAAFSFEERQVRRAGLDHWEYLEFKHYTRFKKFYEAYAQRRIVAVTKSASVSALEFGYLPEDVLLFGNETMGLPPSLLRRIEHKVSLPMSGKVRSLNLSNCVAVVAYAYVAKVFPHAMHEENKYPRTYFSRKKIGTDEN
ncbi:MAG: tRNA (cytidine(34)-2'-O)-methyltransferase [Turneriella sp.]|nr:tRNA (cytidine(34)-2'-O)-methyltransferase [Turneriella sp.]